MNIYIGGFSYDINENDLQDVFEAFGHVESVKIIKDKLTGQSRGFAFIEMPDNREAQNALDGITEVQGKQVTINEARPQEKRRPHGGRRGGPRGNNYNRKSRDY